MTHSVGRVHIHALRAVRLEKDKLVLFAGTDAGLFRSSNSGTTWEQVKSAGITGVSVLAIYAPPAGVSRLAVRTGSGLFISEDSGRTWQAALLPNEYYIYDVALPVQHDTAILAATSRGVLQSTDEGAHWKLVTEGVPAATVDSVRFNPSQGARSLPGSIRKCLPHRRRRRFLAGVLQRGPGRRRYSNAVVRTRPSPADFCAQRRAGGVGFRSASGYCGPTG